MRFVRISLNDEELKWCKNHACEIVEYYGGQGTQGSGTYNHNKVSSNLVGVKSELATSKWFAEAIPKCDIKENFRHFKERGLKGDLQVNKEVVEVKGLRPHQWDRFKRMIPPKQLKHCVRNKAIVIWTLTTGDTKNPEVKLMGWNYAYEVEEYGIEVRTICDNVWLKDDGLMRCMDALVEILVN